jgi:GTP-binding protein
LRALSRARPAVAAYPFTTLNPHVGVVEYEDGLQIAVADIPGLIPGAHKNIGLGHSFLRHIERCRILLFVIDLGSPNPTDQVAQLKYELNMYHTDLGGRPTVIVANKMDLEGIDDAVRELAVKTRLQVVPVSALNKWNIQPLKTLLHQLHTRQISST